MKLITMKAFGLFFLSAIGWSSSAQNVYDVKDFGAKGIKSEKATAYIQKAIDKCAEEGGGTVYLSPGDYTSGQINLRSNVTFHIEAGATLFASRDKNDFFVQEDYEADNQAKTPNKTFLIYGNELENVTIKGRGKIDGQAEHVWEDLRSIDGFIADEIEIAKQSGIEMKRAYAEDPRVRVVYLTHIRNLLIEGITVQSSPDWGVHIGACNHVVVRGISVYSSLTHGVNSDGIDIDGGKNIHISDCTIETGDDAICMKTTYMEGKPVKLENVTVSNCVLTSTSTALKLGTESYADMKNIRFDNCIVTNTNRGIGIFVRDGANVENVTFSNLYLECNRKHFNWWGDGDAIRFVLLKRNDDSRLGSIKNVTIRNVEAMVQGTSIIAGFPTKNIDGLTLDNVSITMVAEGTKDKRTTDALRIEKAENVSLNNVSLKWKDEQEAKWSSGLVLNRLKNIAVDKLYAESGKENKVPAVVLEDCEEAYFERLNTQGEIKVVSGRDIRFVDLYDDSLKDKVRLEKIKEGEVKFQ